MRENDAVELAGLLGELGFNPYKKRDLGGFYLKSAKYRRKMGFIFRGRGNIGLEGILRFSGIKMRILIATLCLY
jgi:hypothetical protein